MAQEGPPSAPLDTDIVAEKAPMPLDKVLEIYQQGDKKAFEAWYLERAALADDVADSSGRFQLTIDCAQIYHRAGAREEAIEAISSANEAIQQELIELDRHDSPMAKRPGREEYQKKLKNLLQNVLFLRKEIFG